MNVAVWGVGDYFALGRTAYFLCYVLNSITYAILCPKIIYKINLSLCRMAYLKEKDRKSCL